MKDSETVEHVERMRVMINEYTILVDRPEGKRALTTPTRQCGKYSN
jgi:hypothetical protein